jgi:N-acyl-D-amino-acid deacylase
MTSPWIINKENKQMTRRRKITRRTVLAGLGGLAVASQALVAPRGTGPGSVRAQQPTRAFDARIPVTGKAGPGLQPFDTGILQIMDRHGLPGAALAIAKNGKLVLARGYGWANVSTGAPIQPETVFGLASLSKSLTAVATLKLVEQGKLGLDDPVFGFLKHIPPPRGARVDPRLRQITIRQCLNHSGGWDRAVHGDPVNWEPQICRAFRVRPPLSSAQFISFVQTLPLNFNPGTDAKYSNVGFILLGEVVARVSRQPYVRFVTDNVVKPIGMTHAGLHGLDGKYHADEAHRYLPGSLIALPAMLLPMVNATGGWSASVVDLARFLTNLDGSRGKAVLSEEMRKVMLAPPPSPLKPRADGTYFGLGWDSVIVKDNTFGFFKDGSYQGMRTFMKRKPDGVCWALLYSSSMEFDPQDMDIARRAVGDVHKLVEDRDKYPNIDLFEEYT